MSIYNPGTMTPRGKDQKQDQEDRKKWHQLSEEERIASDNLQRTIGGP